MKRTGIILRVLAAVAAVVVMTGRAEAAAIVSVTPTPVVVEVGDVFDVFVMIDADDPVGGIDLDVTWDDTVIDWQVISFTSLVTNDLTNDFGGFGPITGSSVNLSIVGDPIGNNLATNPFQAIQIQFIASALGMSAINIPFVDLSDVNGDFLLDVQAAGGLVCVVADAQNFDPRDCVVPVPEPGLLALLGAGLATVAARRRHGRR